MLFCWLYELSVKETSDTGSKDYKSRINAIWEAPAEYCRSERYPAIDESDLCSYRHIPSRYGNKGYYGWSDACKDACNPRYILEIMEEHRNQQYYQK